MTTFLLDLWHDLREKRLWPVAVGLLAATVAIPLVMLKPASEPEPPTVISESGDRETLPALTVDAKPGDGSKLETFDQRNPFKPLEQLDGDDGASSDGGSGGSGGSGSGSSSPSGSTGSFGGASAGCSAAPSGGSG